MTFPWLSCPGLWINCLQAHHTHQASNLASSYFVAKFMEFVNYAPVPVCRFFVEDPVITCIKPSSFSSRCG